ncbi:MAG: ImpA family metalloprotease, partial [Pseudomonadota bacterium]
MLRKVGLASIAVLLAACSGGGSGAMDDGNTSLPGTPPPSTENSPPTVTTTQIRIQIDGDVSESIAAADADGDALTYALVDGPDWISISSDGVLSGTPEADDLGGFELVIDVSDGEDTTRAMIEVTLFMDPIEQALMTGDFTFITEHSDTAMETVLLNEFEAIRARNRNAINEIFELNSDGTLGADSITGIDWSPPALGAHYATRYPSSFPLLKSNRGTVRNLAILGEGMGARYAMFANSPASFGTFDAEAPNSRMIKNTIEWLVQTDTSNGLNAVLAHFPGEFETERTGALLDAAFPDGATYNQHNACNGTRLADCMTEDVDLLILFQHVDSGTQEDAVIEQVRLAMNRGVALILVRRHYNEDNKVFGQRIMDALQAGSSSLIYPSPTYIENGSPVDVLSDAEPDYVAPLEALIRGIQDQNLNYDLSLCSGSVECIENTAFNEEVYTPINALRTSVLDRYSTHIGDPFLRHSDHRLVAALTLTGDYYRDLTRYPMPKATTPDYEIIRALVGEYANVADRQSVPVMPDMGAFSRSAFDHIDLGEVRVTLQGNGPVKTTGLYALPGETFTVTRNDNAANDITIQVNAFSPESRQPFSTLADSEFRHPILLNSAAKPLNRTITVSGNNTTADLNDSTELTSTYGGPIHVFFNSPDEAIDLTFSNVAEHPVWRGAEETESFLIDLAADEFD